MPVYDCGNNGRFKTIMVTRMVFARWMKGSCIKLPRPEPTPGIPYVTGEKDRPCREPFRLKEMANSRKVLKMWR